MRTSRYLELTDPHTTRTSNDDSNDDSSSSVYETYDVIIASDIVCCESDAVWVTHTSLHFLKREVTPSTGCPIAIIVVPTEFHRLELTSNIIQLLLSKYLSLLLSSVLM
jgi:hypothetical protein